MILEYKNSAIHYTLTGEGPAVVLLHGFLETVDMWNDLVPELSKKHQVVCIDLLGHGKSDCLGYVHTMDDMADAVFAVLKNLEINKATFIGHSMGGYVTLALAKKQPQLFEGLCLMNSTFEADDEERKKLRMQANEMVKTHFESLIRMSFANLFAPESRVKFQNELEEALQIALQTPVQGYIAASEGMRLRPDYFDSFRKLNGNKLIIIGLKDWIVDGEKLKSQITNTDIKYVEFSEGHMSHIENKSELSYEIKQFVEK
ncbi:alpha/beta hydrolase [uncultured Winogradskyella sp.]|uniref:alpha/beta fold hydrolase n=1 Tax=uncultured Winogradskyella sp. TaxID=395353 RepID=UPI0026281101|nr:alpha/beta hydrolase [uncultured Winogradskyella sp.]